MTIGEAISKIDALKPNTYTDEEKIGWLSQVDMMIQKEIRDEHLPVTAFDGYTADTDMDTTLIADAPYDNMYVSWMESRIDYYQGEYGKYNNSNAVFEAEYTAYRNWYNRTHEPVGTHFRYF